MYKISILLLFLSLISFCSSTKLLAQIATKFTSRDAVYTTYAAPIARSAYKTDQAYELMWLDPSKAVGLQSKDGGEMGILFSDGRQFMYGAGQYSGEPVITDTYSDIVRLSYQPYPEITVSGTFCVYSSAACILEYRISNTSSKTVEINIYPYFSLNRGIRDVKLTEKNSFSFLHHRNRDNWMKEHNIPLTEDFRNTFLLSEAIDSYGIYDFMPAVNKSGGLTLNGSAGRSSATTILLHKNMLLQPDETRTFRIVRYLTEAGNNEQSPVGKDFPLLAVDLEKVLAESKNAGSNIPVLASLNKLPENVKKDRLGLYYSAFNLLRQCMMPAEGECKTYYYVFSREPKWGWGYGGQVFHESLSMLAYVYMDPQGAMNSQRVFIDRQQKDGYINYRTGPYLNETIETNGMKTCSAPWFSYVNMEIYKVTKDKDFLQQAYTSGRKLYQWMAANRDKDKDGLFEWGGDATLECVRDGEVAVWDKVSRPETLEGPDFNSMMVMEAISLSMMAKELNRLPEAKDCISTASVLADKINKQCWDPETKFYYNTQMSTNGFTVIDSNDLKIKEIIGFLPLWANLAKREQAEGLIQSLSNAEEFWRPNGIPTLSAKDSYYNPMGYWNGPVWIQWNYLIFRGLVDYGYYPLALQLGEKVIEQMSWHLKNDHTFWEFYSPDDRQAGWNKTYIWAGIVARLMIDMDKIRTEPARPKEAKK